MVDNANHKTEIKNNEKLKKSEHVILDNSKLINQDLNENFIDLKKNLIFFQDKSNLENIKSALDEDTAFVKVKEEFDPKDIISQGLDFCILADCSESMYPFRIFLKKSMYYAIKDIESLVYRGMEEGDNFPRVRIAFVGYTDRDSSDTPGKLEILDFVEYSKLEEVIKLIDNITITKSSQRKRNVFDGLKAVSELTWEGNSVKLICHYAADAQYGKKYTSDPLKMPKDFDPFPDGCTDIDDDEILKGVSSIGATFNLIALNTRLVKYQTVVGNEIDLDYSLLEVNKLD